jgi:hypothetical protein
MAFAALLLAGPAWVQAPGTKRMAERIARLIDATEPERSPYMNREKASRLRELLGSGLDLSTELKVRARLAQELLLAGETSECLGELERLEEIVRSKGVILRPEFKRLIRDQRTLAHLRLGEQENCGLHHGVESCLFPIRGSGVHRKQRGSREAIKGLLAALSDHPDDLLARWLLNIAYMTVGEYPEKVPERWRIAPETFASDYDIRRFHDVAPQLGINVVGLAGGSVLEDFDGDGNLDLMVSSSGLRDQLRYFRNNGDGTFTERTSEAGLTGLTGGLNLVQADYDNDGDVDVLVLRGAWMGSQGHYPNSLLRNDGNGVFADVTEEAGLLSFHPTQVAAWGDYDNDGWLDLFVGNESQKGDPHPSELFRNNGDGTFTNVAAQVGLANLGFVKGAAWGDYDNDGRLDLYVSRMGEANSLFRNEGARFRDVASPAGVAEPVHSFATWFWDYNNDGWLDLFVAPYQAERLGDIAAIYLGLPAASERARLYRNNRDGTFTDVTQGANLDRVVVVMGANYGDLDNDGWPDVYLGTGEPDYRALLPNRMFRNAEGRWFQDVTTSGGFGHLQKGHGISFGDIDNDGDQDIFAKMGGAYEGDAFRSTLFLNPGHGNRWLTLVLEGVRANRKAIGARIRVQAGGREIHHLVGSGGSFGANSLQAEIGLGEADAIESVEVRWPGGGVQNFAGMQPNCVYHLREGDAKPRLLYRKVIPLAAR